MLYSVPIFLLFANVLVTSFQNMNHVYKVLGIWNLKGTSSLKYQNSKINLQIIPKNHCKKLNISWTKEGMLGPIIYMDCLEGTIQCIKDKTDYDNDYLYNYKFKPKKYSLSIVTVLGIHIPNVLNIDKNIEERFEIDNIKYDFQNEILFLEINNDHFIFQRNSISNMPTIRLDQFLVSQILGYFIFKIIDHFHIL